MKVKIISVDSDIGAAIRDIHVARGDDVIATSRNGKTNVHFELTNPTSWTYEPVDRVYFAIAHGEGRVSRDEVMKVNALLPIDYLNIYAKSVPNNVEFIVFTSRWGSISACDNARALYYRQSKAALNMGVKSLSAVWPRHSWMLLHPGLVRTKMLRRQNSYNQVPIAPNESAGAFIAMLDKWDKKLIFCDQHGQEIAW